MILTCHPSPVLAELDTALSEMMAPADLAVWQERHLATLKVDDYAICVAAPRVWADWVRWLITDERYGMIRIPAPPLVADAYRLLQQTEDAFVKWETGTRFVFANLFLALENEAQRVGYLTVRKHDDPGTPLKDALRAAAYACAVCAFDAPHHAYTVALCAADAASWPDRTPAGRHPWAMAAATALVEICEENL